MCPVNQTAWFLSLSLSEGLRNIAMDSNSLAMPMSDPNAWATAMNNLGMAPMSMTGQPIMSGKLELSTYGNTLV